MKIIMGAIKVDARSLDYSYLKVSLRSCRMVVSWAYGLGLFVDP